MTVRRELTAIFRAAIAAVHGAGAVERALYAEHLSDTDVCWTIVAAGKAAACMVDGALSALGSRVVAGLATTRDEAEGMRGPVHVRRAGHPLPDERSRAAAEAALACASGVSPQEHLLVLLSGGASALWSAPAGDVPLAEKRELTQALLRAGVPIGPLNAVRKHLSRIKGGGLARAARCPVWTLAISDVEGDLPEVIGSGPTVPDPTTYAEARSVVEQAGLQGLAPKAWKHLCEGARRERSEDETAIRERAPTERYRVVASLAQAIEAAMAAARERGWVVRRLSFDLCGEARELASRLVTAAQQARQERVDLLLTGGEPVVHVRGDGRGGRAQELALAFALAARAEPNLSALFAGTDGSDGTTEAAGAFVDASSLAAARARGSDPQASLMRNDSYAFHAASGGLFVSGPTGTNVTDLALIRIGDAPARVAG